MDDTFSLYSVPSKRTLSLEMALLGVSGQVKSADLGYTYDNDIVTDL